MKLITAIIRTAKLEEVHEMLLSAPIERFTVTNVMGCGTQQGYTESFRNTTIEVNLIKKMKVDIEVQANKVQTIITSIMRICRSGKVGDGKIFVFDIPTCITL